MKVSKKEFIVGTILTLVGIIVGIVMTNLSINSSYEIAERSGSFDKPNPVASLGEIKLDDPEYDRHIIYGSNFPDSSILLSRIPLVIKNEGEITTKNLSVTFRYPSAAHMGFDSSVMNKSVYGRIPIEASRSFTVVRDFEYVSYSISDLNPGEVFILEEPIILPLTEISDTLQIPEIYKGFVTNVILSIPINITISAEDVLTRDFEIQVISFDSNSSENFKEEVTNYLFDQLEKSKENLNLIAKMVDFFTFDKSKTIAEFVKLDTILTGEFYDIGITDSDFFQTLIMLIYIIKKWSKRFKRTRVGFETLILTTRLAV